MITSGAAAVLGLTLPLSTPAVVAAPSPAPAPLPVAYARTSVAMREAGEPYASWAAAGRQFLDFDPGGTAAEVVGDLAAAQRVAILVPGAGTRLVDLDTGLGNIGRRAVAGQARRLRAALTAADPAVRVAVVAWVGYHPPPGLGLESARDVVARSGAQALVQFVRGLPGGAPITLVGHSYGAIVAGLAARELPQVTDVVALGAPGLGVDHAAELGGTRVWAALAPDDWIRRLPQVRFLRLGHGRRPASSDFGARPLPTDGVAGHDYYFEPGAATLSAVARVVLAADPAVAS